MQPPSAPGTAESFPPACRQNVVLEKRTVSHSLYPGGAEGCIHRRPCLTPGALLPPQPLAEALPQAHGAQPQPSWGRLPPVQLCPRSRAGAACVFLLVATTFPQTSQRRWPRVIFPYPTHPTVRPSPRPSCKRRATFLKKSPPEEGHAWEPPCF